MAIKKDKLNNIVQRELSSIIQNEVKNSGVGFCTITGVDVTSDLSYAKVYVSFLNKNAKKSLEALENSKGFIRSTLARRLTVRKCPELIFVLDTSLDYGNKIESILDEINKK